VFLIVKFGISFGPMKKFEEAASTGDDISRVEATKVATEVEIQGTKATQWTLIVPILVLVFMTFFMMFIAAGFSFGAIMDQSITVPLFVGGVTSFVTAVIFAVTDRNVKLESLVKASGKGMFAMFKSAVAILVLAWMVSGAIQDLGTGDLIAEVVAGSNLATSMIPLALFIIAGGMAFATGTSWGSFGILLPIAIPIAMATNPEFMPAIVAAVLGGAVFGDHSSPVSDTTVLSATGAQSTLHSHFITQLPYALVTAGIAAFGYLIYGLTEMLLVAYLAVGIVLFLMVFFRDKIFNRKKVSEVLVQPEE
jgi:tetracycline resistance efflux pump